MYSSQSRKFFTCISFVLLPEPYNWYGEIFAFNFRLISAKPCRYIFLPVLGGDVGVPCCLSMVFNFFWLFSTFPIIIGKPEAGHVQIVSGYAHNLYILLVSVFVLSLQLQKLFT